MKKINDELFSEDLKENELTDLSKIIGGLEDPGTKKADDCNVSGNQDDCDTAYKNDSTDTSDTVRETDHCNEVD
ncbi:hypothetical protein [Pedobacter sandarakinus]|uniref:hypothetical protein n=1 Tax=Pedobacter sandarakinus TaxID=353156 RepID=UPI0022477475|nr:hypothetical protein [Pedobacter sandarakinus]MCX2575960.1 hypothetical protein [Pedobacter sandarakinus]